MCFILAFFAWHHSISYWNEPLNLEAESRHGREQPSRPYPEFRGPWVLWIGKFSLFGRNPPSPLPPHDGLLDRRLGVRGFGRVTPLLPPRVHPTFQLVLILIFFTPQPQFIKEEKESYTEESISFHHQQPIYFCTTRISPIVASLMSAPIKWQTMISLQNYWLRQCKKCSYLYGKNKNESISGQDETDLFVRLEAEVRWVIFCLLNFHGEERFQDDQVVPLFELDFG